MTREEAEKEEKKEAMEESRREELTVPKSALSLSLSSSYDTAKVEEHQYKNQSGRYGLAGERVRALLEAENPPKRTQRASYLRSVYAHAGIMQPCPQYETPPLAPPLIMASTFNIRSSGAYSDSDYFYGRVSNPTRDALEEGEPS